MTDTSRHHSAMDTTAVPSMTDLQNLRQRLLPPMGANDKTRPEFNWRNITVSERWRYHAYDYAFLRSSGTPQDSGYALDPDGKWFNEGLVQAAERVYAQPQLSPKAPILQADVERDPEMAAHFRRQDDERIPLKRQVQIHGERQSDRSPTPEMLAFMACCVRQQQANEKIFGGRSRNAFRPEARMTPQQIHEALGVVVTERKSPKHEDPEELRKGAKELGIWQ